VQVEVDDVEQLAVCIVAGNIPTVVRPTTASVAAEYFQTLPFGCPCAIDT
jgi:hypothetical protein